MFRVACVVISQAAASVYPTSGWGAEPAHRGVIQDRPAAELTYLWFQMMAVGEKKVVKPKATEVYIHQKNWSFLIIRAYNVTFIYSIKVKQLFTTSQLSYLQPCQLVTRVKTWIQDQNKQCRFQLVAPSFHFHRLKSYDPTVADMWQEAAPTLVQNQKSNLILRCNYA